MECESTPSYDVPRHIQGEGWEWVAVFLLEGLL